MSTATVAAATTAFSAPSAPSSYRRHATDVVAYTFAADVWCPACVPGGPEGTGPDADGNPAAPVFASDAMHAPQWCAACGASLDVALSDEGRDALVEMVDDALCAAYRPARWTAEVVDLAERHDLLGEDLASTRAVGHATAGALDVLLATAYGPDGEPVDARGRVDADDLSADAVDELRDDVAQFLAAGLADVFAVLRAGASLHDVGADFVLDRNGEGAGAWDRGHGPAGDRLAEGARAYGPLRVECRWEVSLVAG